MSCIHAFILNVARIAPETHLVKTIESTWIRHRSDAEVSNRCLIDVDPGVFAIWGTSFSISGSMIMSQIYCHMFGGWPAWPPFANRV